MLSNCSIDVLSLVEVLHPSLVLVSIAGGWLVWVRRVAGSNISRGSNIELSKLRTPLFEVGKVLFTALIWNKSLRRLYNKPSALSNGISPSSKFTILDETSLTGNGLNISRSLANYLCKRNLLVLNIHIISLIVEVALSLSENKSR